jgi:hypothetical protein
MRKYLLAMLAGSFLLSCNNEKKTKTETTADKDTTAGMTTTQTTTTTAPTPDPLEKFLGSFVGAFGDNKITFLIVKVKGDSVVGRSIVGGNDRPFYGTFHTENNRYYFSGKEPGDHKDDGTFTFIMTADNPDQVDGGWQAYAKGRPTKSYNLKRKKFEYRTDVGSWPESSQRLLKPADVENMMKEDLEFMRNEIFARHGYCFNKKHLRQQFEMEDWYVPNTVDIKGFLTDIEKKNIEMIKRYEKYADEYGDEYGR